MYTRTDEADSVMSLAGDYVTAMLDADGERLRRLFDPRASVIGHADGVFDFSSLEDFIATTGDAKSGDGPFDYRIENLVLVGDTAVVTASNYCYGQWYTDHLSMLKVDGAWRIVAKTFYAHPPG